MDLPSASVRIGQLRYLPPATGPPRFSKSRISVNSS